MLELNYSVQYTHTEITKFSLYHLLPISNKSSLSTTISTIAFSFSAEDGKENGLRRKGWGINGYRGWQQGWVGGVARQEPTRDKGVHDAIWTV